MKTSHSGTVNINKSNLTLWKNQNLSNHSMKEDPVENEYIENLKKQAYLMEMELNLMKEREREIEKTGGFTQLFNDDRDPSQHILQLKSKYSSMRKNMEGKLEELEGTKRSVAGMNLSLKSKLDSVKKLEREVYQKLIVLEEKSNKKLSLFEEDLLKRNRERLELEANYRLSLNESNMELSRNIELEWTLESEKKTDEYKQQGFEAEMAILEEMTREKIKTYEQINKKITELENKTSEEPYYKTEVEKNKNYKTKIEKLEREILEINTTIESLEKTNEYINEKKDNVVKERKRLIDTNEELKHEIEAKNQLNEIRVQKKVKENNSEEINNLEKDLEKFNSTSKELEEKIQKENEKKKFFALEIIKLNIDLRHKEAMRKAVVESVDGKIQELNKLKEEMETMRKYSVQVKEQIQKETADNAILRNRYKLLMEEYASIAAKYNFVVQNYDYTSNLKKISIEDLKMIKETNKLVNQSIKSFSEKVDSYKKQNLQNLY